MADPLLSGSVLLVSQLNPPVELLYSPEEIVSLLLLPSSLHGVRVHPLDQGHELLLGLTGVLASILLLDSKVGHLLGGRGKLSYLLMGNSKLCSQSFTLSCLHSKELALLPTAGHKNLRRRQDLEA